jgi:hypothetical protein
VSAEQGASPWPKTPSEEAGRGLAAAVGSVEDLGEEHPQGHSWVIESVAEAELFGLDSVLDLIVGQEIGKGQSGILGELMAKPGDLAEGRRGGTMSHWMASLRVEDQCHPHSSKAGHLLLTPYLLNV